MFVKLFEQNFPKAMTRKFYNSIGDKYVPLSYQAVRKMEAYIVEISNDKRHAKLRPKTSNPLEQQCLGGKYWMPKKGLIDGLWIPCIEDWQTIQDKSLAVGEMVIVEYTVDPGSGRFYRTGYNKGDLPDKSSKTPPGTKSMFPLG
jgi:hypothetical protein